MKVLVLGSGGREHALVWKLRQSPRVEEIFCAPGNAGTGLLGRNVPLSLADHAGLIEFALRMGISLTVVGPDDVLAAGIVNAFQAHGLRIFGPEKSAARFESSKIFAKDFMQRHGIPTASYGHFSASEEAHAFCRGVRYPVVIKADGLALGKGVVIARSADEAAKTIYRMMERGQFGASGRSVVIEEFLTGQECSLHALIDGRHSVLFPAAQDHKQAFDGDSGPNTGGMGTFSPAGIFTEALREQVERKVLAPFMAGLQSEGIAYRGLLFPGLILTADGPRVLEFNCRFGDPETQVFLPRLKSDLLDAIEGVIDGDLRPAQLEWDTRAAVCVVMASGGYPGAYVTGKVITGLEEIDDPEVIVFHAGTRAESGQVFTAGGRVLGVTGLGADLREARERAYAAVARIRFEGARYRTDIAAKGLGL
jgi:phosphoribosylamine--glycine ligase